MKQLLLNFLVHISFPLKYAYHGMALYTKVKSMILNQAKIKFNYCPRYLSDKGQDRWVIEEIFKGKRFGYFLDIGAADGFSTSNTFILETRYDWNGLCVEPNPILYNQMVTQHNRKAVVVRECIDQIEREIEFIMNGN